MGLFWSVLEGCDGVLRRRGRGRGTYIVGATVDTELGGQGDGAAEEEEGVQNIERERDRGGGQHAGECAGDEEE